MPVCNLGESFEPLQDQYDRARRKRRRAGDEDDVDEDDRRDGDGDGDGDEQHRKATYCAQVLFHGLLKNLHQVLAYEGDTGELVIISIIKSYVHRPI